MSMTFIVVPIRSNQNATPDVTTDLEPFRQPSAEAAS